MSTNVIYQDTWTEFGEGFRLTIIPRGVGPLPGGFVTVALPNNFIEGWKIRNAKFPGDRHFGMMMAPSLEIVANPLALESSTDLTDLRGYLQDPRLPAGNSLTTGGFIKVFATTNVVVLETDNRTSGASWETLFVGCQRVIPGEEYDIKGAGTKGVKVTTTFTFAHALLYTFETILPDWLSIEAQDVETPLGPYGVAFNLLYYDGSLVYAVREWVSGQQFHLYSATDMFGTHLARLATDVYDTLLRNAYGSATVTLEGYNVSGVSDTTESPANVPRYFDPDYTTSYDSNVTIFTDIYMKGIIEDTGATELGGWYSSLSDRQANVYQWDNCFDLLKDHSDTCKTTLWQVTPEAMKIQFLPIWEQDVTGTDPTLTLTATDIHEGSVKVSKQKGMVRGARVAAKTSGSSDKGDHRAIAVGIRSEEEVTLKATLHNQIPLWDALTKNVFDTSGTLNTTIVNAGDYRIAEIKTLTTNTLYFVDTAIHDPLGSPTTLTNGDQPILCWPGVDIRRTKFAAYTGGYDISAFTPLPTPSAAADFVDEIEGAMITAQQNSMLPHVLAEFVVNEFGTGNVDSPVWYEITAGSNLQQKVRMKHMGWYITLDPDIFLAPGETWFTEVPTGAFLVGYESASDGSAKLMLFGYTQV